MEEYEGYVEYEEYVRGLHGYGNSHSDRVPPGLDCRSADGTPNMKCGCGLVHGRWPHGTALLSPSLSFSLLLSPPSPPPPPPPS